MTEPKNKTSMQCRGCGRQISHTYEWVREEENCFLHEWETITSIRQLCHECMLQQKNALEQKHPRKKIKTIKLTEVEF
jgi:hypothetical protein